MSAPTVEPSLEDRRTRAVAGARHAIETLRARGVEAKVIGSLANGRFGPCSDVDLLIVACPRELKYAIEGWVEDCLDGLPFDVVYLDEVPAWRLTRFTREAIDASRLR